MSQYSSPSVCKPAPVVSPKYSSSEKRRTSLQRSQASNMYPLLHILSTDLLTCALLCYKAGDGTLQGSPTRHRLHLIQSRALRGPSSPRTASRQASVKYCR